MMIRKNQATHVFNNQTRNFDSATKMQIPANFLSQLKQTLHKVINVFSISRENGGFVCRWLIKVEFETDYAIAHLILHGLCDLILSTDSNILALVEPLCLDVCHFSAEQKGKHQKAGWLDTHIIGGSSNEMMTKL